MAGERAGCAVRLDHAETAPSRRSAALTNFLFSYASAIFAILTGVVLVPLYLRFFSLDVYGAWLASGGIAAMLGIADGGFSQVMAQRLASAAGARDSQRFAEVAGSGWAFLIGAAFLISGLGLLIAPHVPDWVHAPDRAAEPIRWAFSCAVGGTALTLLQTALFAAAYAWQRTSFVGVTALAGYAVGLVTIVVGLNAGAGVLALGLGMLARGALIAVLAAWHVAAEWRGRRMPRPRVGRSELAAQGKVAGTLVAGRALFLAVTNGEAALLAVVATPALAATYVLTSRVYSVCQMLVNPIAGSSFSGIAHLKASEPARVSSVLGELMSISGGATGLVVGVAAALNESFVRMWVGDHAYSGRWVDAGIALSTVVVLRSNLLGQVVPAVGALRAASAITVLEAGSRLALMLVLVRTFGVIGLPAASIVASLGVAWSLYATVLAKQGVATSRGFALSLIPTMIGIGFGTVIAPTSGVGSFTAWALVLAALDLILLASLSREVRAQLHGMWSILRRLGSPRS